MLLCRLRVEVVQPQHHRSSLNNDRQPKLLQRWAGSTEERFSRSHRKHQKPAARLSFVRDEQRMLASCKILASAHLYAQPPQQTGCEPGLSLGHNELGRMSEHTLRAWPAASYRRVPGPRRTPSSRGRPAPRARPREHQMGLPLCAALLPEAECDRRSGAASTRRRGRCDR